MFSRLPFVVTVAMLIASACPSRAANDYPTSARADYVFACMQANGQTHEMLDRCSCSIDVIASILPYDRYETAETFRSMALTTGEGAELFRESAPAKAAGGDLRRAQAEADVVCF